MFMYQDALLLPQQDLINLEQVANFDDLPIPAPVPAGKQKFPWPILVTYINLCT